MRQLIRQREIVADDWREAGEGDVAPLAHSVQGEGASASPAQVTDATAPAGRDHEDPALSLIVPIARWRAERERWIASLLRLGVRIGPADRVESLEPDLARLSLVAIEFTGPSEGRGYTQARILRDRYRFTGELRAVGYVKRDQLLFMARCGFDSFELSDGVDAQQALAAFDDFTVAYQPATETHSPLRRRVTA